MTPTGTLWYDRRMIQQIHVRLYPGDKDIIGAIAEQVAIGVTQNRAVINLMRAGIGPAQTTPTLTAAQLRVILRDELSSVTFAQSAGTREKAPDEAATNMLLQAGTSMTFDYEEE